VPKDCTPTCDHLKIASNTESEDLEDEVEETEEAGGEGGGDVIVVESVNAKGKSKESAV